jgi:hypothetical protein
MCAESADGRLWVVPGEANIFALDRMSDESDFR